MCPEFYYCIFISSKTLYHVRSALFITIVRFFYCSAITFLFVFICYPTQCLVRHTTGLPQFVFVFDKQWVKHTDQLAYFLTETSFKKIKVLAEVHPSPKIFTGKFISTWLIVNFRFVDSLINLIKHIYLSLKSPHFLQDLNGHR